MAKRRTVNGEPVLDQVAESVETDPSVSLKVWDDTTGQETLVFILEGQRKIPMKQGLFEARKSDQRGVLTGILLSIMH
jgi:hypothetical protein